MIDANLTMVIRVDN